jgi:hypothetical protein
MKQIGNIHRLTSLFSREFQFNRQSGGADFPFICIFARKCENRIQFAEIRTDLRQFLRSFHSILRDCAENNVLLNRKRPEFAKSQDNAATFPSPLAGEGGSPKARRMRRKPYVGRDALNERDGTRVRHCGSPSSGPSGHLLPQGLFHSHIWHCGLLPALILSC